MTGLFSRVRSLWNGLRRPAQLAAEMDEEMRFHIAMEAERLVREDSLDEQEALRQAAIAFGGVEKRKEQGRRVRGLTWLYGLGLDLKIAWRMLWKSPGLTIVGVLGLALGIGVAVGFFVALSTVLYPTLPLEEGERIVALENWDIEANNEERRSLHDFVMWRDEMRSVEQIAAFAKTSPALITGDAPPLTVTGAAMTAAGFDVARVPPLHGRYLLADDEREGSPRVVVLGYDLWESRFESDPRVIGRSILVGGDQHVVVGVMPPRFVFPKNQELWTPLRASPSRYERGTGPQLFVFGRLAAGATREQAQAELTAIGRRTATVFPETNAQLRPAVLPYTHPLDDIQNVRLWEAAMVQAMVSLLLIAIAVNIAILVHARTAMRQGEIAVRTALGASRGRIVAQLFVEALVLSLIAAAIGLTLAHTVLGQGRLVLSRVEGLGFWIDYSLQPRSVAFAILLAILATIIVGVVPGLKSTGRRLTADLRNLGGGGTSVRLGWTWTALIIVQVAVAVAVLPTAVAIGYKEIRGIAVRTTFPAHEFLEAGISITVPLLPGMDAAGYRRETAAQLALRIPELEQRLEAEPDVAGVTIEGRPLGWGSVMAVEGVTPAEEQGGVRSVGVAFDYFDALGARMLAGRDFRVSDASGTSRTVIVNEAFVRQILQDDDVLGRGVRFSLQTESGDDVAGPWLEIVGVVQDLHASAVDRDVAPPVAYFPVAPGDLQSANLLVRVRGGETNGFAPRLRQITAAVDADFRLGTVGNVATMHYGQIVTMIIALLMFVLGTVVLLSAAGIHALTSLTVTRRRREIGIRAALGARPGRLLASVFARAAWQLGLGAAIGAVFGTALLSGNDLMAEAVLSLSSVVVIMLVAGLFAAIGPARRGLRIQPMEALREE